MADEFDPVQMKEAKKRVDEKIRELEEEFGHELANEALKRYLAEEYDASFADWVYPGADPDEPNDKNGSDDPSDPNFKDPSNKGA